MTQPVSGHVYRFDGKRGSTWRAKYRLPDGRQVKRTIGPAWTERGRPRAGYYTKRTAEAWLREVLRAPYGFLLKATAVRSEDGDTLVGGGSPEAGPRRFFSGAAWRRGARALRADLPDLGAGRRGPTRPTSPALRRAPGARRQYDGRHTRSISVPVPGRRRSTS